MINSRQPKDQRPTAKRSTANGQKINGQIRYPFHNPNFGYAGICMDIGRKTRFAGGFVLCCNPVLWSLKKITPLAAKAKSPSRFKGIFFKEPPGKASQAGKERRERKEAKKTKRQEDKICKNPIGTYGLLLVGNRCRQTFMSCLTKTKKSTKKST
jgi:hypothetical protein